MVLSKNSGTKWALSAALIFFSSILLAVPFVPDYSGDLQPERVYPSERFTQNSRGRDLPDNILVLLVEFTDIKFNLESEYPDYHPHDVDYFSKYLEHLSEYYRDVSHGNYQLSLDNFTIHENVFTAPHTMAYYGEDSSGKTALLISDLIADADAEIDFSPYDGYIVFHAGAGQEAYSDNADEIISTFLSRKSFQAYFEPENDNYPGLETDDDVYLNEFVLCPETLWQPNFVEPDVNGENGSPIYSFFGVLAHHFGHLIGLPTLFDNVSSNGTSQGIGGYGIMGIGAWNGAGYVPAPPCAWSRTYLGWEDVVEIDSASLGRELTSPSAENDKPKLYKISISDTEYFLLENMQQNPDNSMFVKASGDTVATYTFPLSDNQEYYDVNPYTGEPHPYAGQPKFDFFENSYTGSEWQFYMPGYHLGDALENDGSGILIWHIDELLINEHFTSDFMENTINGDASHKGVDLEEADGIQNLDNYYTYAYGDKNDSFRAGNNDYFGKRVHNGLFSAPTSESYYGGNLLEISNISEADSIMTFDVSFGWSLSVSYAGEVEQEAAIIDFDNDGENEMFFAMPDGHLTVWKDDLVIAEYIPSSDGYGIEQLYAWDELNHTFIIPAYLGESVSYLNLFSEEEEELETLYPTDEYEWAAAPVINPDAESVFHLFMAENTHDGSTSLIKIWDQAYNEQTEITWDSAIISNLMLKDNTLAFITDSADLIVIDLELNLPEIYQVPELAGKTISSALWVDLDCDEKDDFAITTDDHQLYCYSAEAELMEHFPIELPVSGNAVPSLADTDDNGYLELVYGSENNFVLVDYLANISQPENLIESPDSLGVAGGAIALDLNNDGDLEVLANVSHNRLAAWERISDNNFRLMAGFPTTFLSASNTYPIVGDYASYGKTIYYSANNGLILKQENPGMDLSSNPWLYQFGNLQRTASYLPQLPGNQYETDEIFIKDEIYFFPNPLSVIATGSITNGVYRENTISLNLMTGKDVEVDIIVYNVSGNHISSGTLDCRAYIKSNYFIDCSKLSSGVYFTVIKSGNKVLKKKFAIEK